MNFERPILQGVFVQRYKRFFADVRLPEGVVTAHCVNTGSMKGCVEAGRPVLISDHGADCGRKLRYTFEAIQMGEHWIGVNTGNPNRVVAEAIAAGRIEELAGYAEITREVKYGANSRIDLLLSGHRARPKQKCYVEVKNTTLRDGDGALFPDSVTERGLKHIHELTKVIRRGHRGVFLFFVHRTDCEWMAPAELIDPEYSKALRKAVRGGLEAYAYRAKITLQGISVEKSLPVKL